MNEIYLHSSQNIADNYWDELVNDSEESSPFLQSSFLRSIGLEDSRVIVMEGVTPIVGSCLVSPDREFPENSFAYTAYQGIFFPKLSREDYSGENEALRRLGLFINLIDAQKEVRHFSLHPRINDLRPVIWHYHENNDHNLKATILTRYTGQIMLKEYVDFDQYLNSIQKVRCREYKSSLQRPQDIDSNSWDIPSFLKMYKATFHRQKLDISDSLVNRCSTIIKEALKSGTGRLRILYSDHGDPAAGVFILSNETTDVYLFGASDPNFHKLNGSTRLLLDSIKDSFSAARANFDFCGMNSPGRGYFKSTFNARVTPYFELDLSTKDEF